MTCRIASLPRTAGIFLILVAAFSGPLQAGERVWSIPDAGQLDLFECLPVRADSAPAADAKLVLQRDFVERCATAPQLGFQKNPLWVKLKIRNDGPDARQGWLEYDNPIVRQLDVFIFNENNELIQRFEDGYASRDTSGRARRNWPMFRLPLEARSQQTVLMRIQSPYFVRANIRFLSDADMHTKIVRRSVVHGVFYGIGNFMLLFFIGGLLVIRQRVFAIMIPALLLFMVFFLMNDGFYYAYRDILPPAPDLIVLLIICSMPWANVLTVLFAADLMEIRRETSPGSFYLIAGIITAYGGVTVLYPINFPLGIGLFQIFAVGASGILITLLVRGWRQGKRHLRFVFLAFLPAFAMAPLFLLIYTQVMTIPRVDLPIMRFPLLFGLVCVALSALDRIAISRRRYTEQLAIDVENKTAQLNTARQHAEDANKFKESLVRMVAHDLRSPLSAIKTNLPLLKSRSDVALEDRNKIVAEIASTIDGLLQFAKYLLSERHIRESAWYKQPAWCDLRSIANEAISQSEVIFHLKGVVLDNKVAAVEWHLDPEYMYRILGNLLSNAVKFSRPDDRVSLESPSPETLVVADTGVGMSEATLLALREERAVSNPGTDGEHGRGMGLQQCIELIRVQGGTLSIDSAPGLGARFTIRWPEGRWRIARSDRLDESSPASA